MPIERIARTAGFLFAAWSLAASAQLSIDPPAPSPLDTVRLRYAHTGCTNPDSIRVAQAANVITVQVDRTFAVDCGTVAGFFEEFALGRLPSGDYDAQLVVNPPPPTLPPSQLVGPIHFTVSALPQTGTPHPHENYEGMWWKPSESGWALNVFQSGEKLVLVWAIYGSDGSPTWFVMPSGAWSRDSAGVLHYSGAIYRTQGPPWTGTFDPAAVTIGTAGTAVFTPRGSGRSQFGYTILDVTALKDIERFRF